MFAAVDENERRNRSFGKLNEGAFTREISLYTALASSIAKVKGRNPKDNPCDNALLVRASEFNLLRRELASDS